MKKFSGLVLLIISNETKRKDILAELSAFGIDAIATDTVEEALGYVDLSIGLVCFSTDGISENKSHDRDYILSHTHKVRHALAKPLFFVLDDCDEPLEAVEPITIVNSHFNAPAIIKERWDGN